MLPAVFLSLPLSQIPLLIPLLIPYGLPLVSVLIFVIYFKIQPNLEKNGEGTKEIPGPSGIPWLGPVHKLPSTHVWTQFKKWHDQYGPIYRMTLFGVNHVWICSEKISTDLLARRGAKYSDRAVVPNVPGTRTDAEYLPLLGNNEMLARHRKFAHQILMKAYETDYFQYPLLEVKRLIPMLLRNPTDYPRLIEEFTCRVICRLAWEDPTLSRELMSSAAGLLAAISPQGSLPNAIPSLMMIPKAINPWVYRERKRHAAQKEFFLRAQQHVRKRMEAGITDKSFTRTFFSEKDRYKFMDDKEGAFAVGMICIAGALPMSSPIQTFILAMCHYPYWFAKLQQEIDLVCGDRLPEYSDSPRLPILRAIAKELLRWRPPVPTGVPHELQEDDIYEGYFLPKGTQVHPMEWAHTRDEGVYPNPERFNPNRYLDPSFPTYKAPLSKYPTVINHHVFGYGRRVCMGMEIVDVEMVIGIGALAWACDISKKKDANGIDVSVHWNNFTDLLITRPEPFVFDIKPRNEKRAMQIEQYYQEAVKKDPHIALPVNASDT